MPKIYDLVGERVGRLVVESYHGKHNTKGYCEWLCKCDCGGLTIVPTCRLTKSLTRSCGCLLIEARKNMGIRMRETRRSKNDKRTE